MFEKTECTIQNQQESDLNCLNAYYFCFNLGKGIKLFIFWKLLIIYVIMSNNKMYFNTIVHYLFGLKSWA